MCVCVYSMATKCLRLMERKTARERGRKREREGEREEGREKAFIYI